MKYATVCDIYFIIDVFTVAVVCLLQHKYDNTQSYWETKSNGPPYELIVWGKELEYICYFPCIVDPDLSL